jgi:hypothetical protein
MTGVHQRANAARAVIERDFPHQVALQNDLCCDRNYSIIADFCRQHGLDHRTRGVTAIFPCGREIAYRVHCFATPAAAEAFRLHFGGEPFDPARDRGKGDARNAWRRTDTWRRILESGPLKLPPILI